MSRGEYRARIHEVIGRTPAPEVPQGVIAPDWSAMRVAAPDLQGQGGATDAQDNPLPEFSRASDITPGEIKLPGVLVERILHQGCKMVISGGSKSYKSWLLIDLGLAVASGTDWLTMPTKQTKVLYVNFELIEGFFEQRVVSVCKAKGIELPESFLIWNLRGKCYDLSVLAKILVARIGRTPGIGMIIIDPLYKALGGLDENSASEMADLMLQIEKLGDSIGAAVIFGSHFSKGNQAGKESMDRQSGSGVFARDPDAIMSMTRHEDEGCYTIEADLRYMAPISKFVVQWQFPIMVVDESKDPNDLYVGRSVKENKFAHDKAKEPPAFSTDDVLNLIPHSGLLAESWNKLCQQKFGKAGQDFYIAKGNLLKSGQVVKTDGKYYPRDYKLRSV